MFSSKKDTAPPPPPANVPPAKRAARSSAPSIISADLVVNGTLISTGDIQIDGRVEGDVHSSGLVIGDKAFIQGEVLADDVTVRGRIQGGIRARKVLLCATSHVEGNILHEAFAVEAGAFFEGNCRHSDNPLSEEFSRAKTQDYQNRPAPTPVLAAAAQPKANEPRPAMTPPSTATYAPLKTGA